MLSYAMRKSFNLVLVLVLFFNFFVLIEPYSVQAAALPVKAAKIAAGNYFAIALKSDGTVAAWGDNSLGQTDVPAGLTDVINVAAGGEHSLALKSDGTVVAWGHNAFHQTEVPAGLTNVVAISAGGYHSFALKSDGTLVGWGLNGLGQAPMSPGVTGVTAVSAGDSHTLILKSDGTVVAIGNNADGRSTVPNGLNDAVAIAAGQMHSLALRSNGTVVAWGNNTFHQTEVPMGLTNVVAIAAGQKLSLALKSDGTVVTWGSGEHLPAGLTDVVSITTKDAHSLALKADGTVVTSPTFSSLYRIPGSADLSGIHLQEGNFEEAFQSSRTSYTFYYDGHSLSGVHITPTLESSNQTALYVNNVQIASGSAKEIDIAGATTDTEILVRTEPYFLPGKTYTITLKIDSTAPTVQFTANGQATAATAAATEVTVSDTQSGVDAASLKYAWTQSTAVPAGGWSPFSSGATLSRTSGNGNWYLHVQAADKAGNVVNAVSNPFVLDNTAPTVTVSSSAGGKVNASFPVTIIFSEGVTGFTEDDLVINNGTASDFTSVSAVTYSAIISPTNSGQAVTVTVAAGAAADAAGNENTASNTLSLLYDKTKPVVIFGGFTDNQLFIAPPAAVTVSVNEAVYWIAEGTELTSANALPLISMEKDGEAFAAYTPSYDEVSGTFSLTFNDALEDGEYKVLVAGDAVRNEFQNTLDAASASFTVAVPVITGISANPASLTSSGGSTTVTITGVNLLGQTVSVYVDGVEAATAVVSSAENAEVTVGLPYNATQTANDHIFTVYLNGVEVTGQSSTVTVNAASPPTVSYSSQADLARLQVSASGKTLDLSSAFASGTTAYTVETDAEQVELQLATADSKAIVKLLGERMDASTNVKLAMGANVLAITVQAEDGTLKTYTLTINRIAVPDPIPSTPACPFTDMENHWAKSAVCEAASLGIVEGVTEHTFAPNSYVTRTEFAIMLLRTLQTISVTRRVRCLSATMTAFRSGRNKGSGLR